MNTEIIVGIVIFLCIFVFLVVIFFASGVSDYTPQQNTIATSTGLFLSSCANVPCENNLVCDGTNFTCKFPEGELCNNYSDCVSGLICSGICTPPPVGTLDQPCPCDEGFFCKITPGQLNVCKLGPGSFCNSNADCLSGNCVGTPNGICSADPPPIVNPTQGILFTCNDTNSCIGGTVCMSQTSPNICNTTTGCSCIFPYNNPNLPVNNLCIGGMSNINGECYNNVGLPCQASSNCASLSCGGGSVMAAYNFNPGLPSGINFLGSTNTSVQTLFSGPTGLIDPYKMFAVPHDIVNEPADQKVIDTIYLVDYKLGLLVTTYNVSTKIGGSWTPLIDYITTTPSTTRVLIDATLYTNSSLLVAFNETTTNNLTYSTVYTFDISTKILTPFNIQVGSGINGTQYQSPSNNPITISYINANSQSDVLLVGKSNGTVYVKNSGQTKYTDSNITKTIGPVYFYSNDTGASFNNIAFVGSFNLTISGSTTILPQVLQFSGAIAGTALPADPYNLIQYNVFDYSIFSPGVMTSSNISMLTTSTVGGIVSLLYNGLRTFFPLRITSSFRTVSTSNAFYILSPASCT